MIQPEIERRSPGPLANTLTIVPMSGKSFKQLILIQIIITLSYDLETNLFDPLMGT